jgi:hypothetical protein
MCLVERQSLELDRLKDRVAWQNRLIKEVMGRTQVRRAYATPLPFSKRDAVYLGRENQASFEFIG